MVAVRDLLHRELCVAWENGKLRFQERLSSNSTNFWSRRWNDWKSQESLRGWEGAEEMQEEEEKPEKEVLEGEAAEMAELP